MNRLVVLFIVVLVSVLTGLWIEAQFGWLGGRGPATQPGSSSMEPEILYWVAPMDANYRRDEPGKSPMGMDLVPVYADDRGQDDDAITIRPEVVQNLGVRTARVEMRPLWRRVEATGTVGVDESRLSDLNVRSAGWVEQLEVVEEGARVQHGQLLFRLYSPEIENAQRELLGALRRGNTALTDAAGQKLRVLGMSKREIARLREGGKLIRAIEVIAPQDGIVTDLHVREGMYVKPDMMLLSLADLSTVWLQAEVFESQAGWVRAGQSAEARLDYMPGEVFAGTVDYVYPILDAKTRTLRVRLRFDNPRERLKPNMYAGVTLFGGHHDALAVPREALIPAPDRDRVVLDLGDGRFRVHEIMTGIESGDWVEVITGLERGDNVVVSAQFLLDSEASMAGSIRRLSPGDMTRSPQQAPLVFASGIIKSIEPGEQLLRIAHGPVDDLGWPPMTMEFAVAPEVDLESLQTGQNIHFGIRRQGLGEYAVEMIHLVDAGEGTDGQSTSSETRAEDPATETEHQHD